MYRAFPELLCLRDLEEEIGKEKEGFKVIIWG